MTQYAVTVQKGPKLQPTFWNGKTWEVLRRVFYFYEIVVESYRF